MIKSYTDISQSKKLAEILPLKSANMYYSKHNTIHANTLYGSCDIQDFKIREYIPCWSLAALLSVASTCCSRLEITLRADKKYNVFAVKDDFVFRSFDNHPDGFDNLVDACVDMVMRLNELNLL